MSIRESEPKRTNEVNESREGVDLNTQDNANSLDTINGNERKPVSHAKKAGIGFVAGAAAVAAIIGGVASANAPKEAPAVSQEVENPDEDVEADYGNTVDNGEVVDPVTDLQSQMETNIASRPEQGTPEYEALFANIGLPEASVTDPKTVIDSYLQSIYVELPKLIIADAPGGGDDDATTDWQLQGDGRSVASLVEQLDIDYFLDGTMDKLSGESWQDIPYEVHVANDNLKPTVQEIVTVLLGDGLSNENFKYVPGNHEIIGASDELILARSQGDLVFAGNAKITIDGLVRYIVPDNASHWIVSGNPYQ